MRLSSIARHQETGLLAVVLLLGLALTLLSGDIEVHGRVANNFLRVDNVVPNVLTPMSWMAIMAIGTTVVIVAGGIDISVGSIFGLAALGTCAVLERLPEDAGRAVVWPAAAAAALGIGVACGLLNGALVTLLRIHPFLVTLGTMSIFRGVALVAVPQKTLPSLGRSLPHAFGQDGVAAKVEYLRLQPVPIAVMLVALLCGHLFLARTVAGREVYALGSNAVAARYAGLPVHRITLRVYAISGLCAGLAGLLSAGFYQSASTATGEGYELQVIAAAVVGGASLLGGRGTALGAVLGALVIKLIENGIDLVREKELHKIIVGAAILIAVAADRLVRRGTGEAPSET
jgi:ribose/xylose/arabinose/galactoside ABC-type transport system permease subunit